MAMTIDEIAETTIFWGYFLMLYLLFVFITEHTRHFLEDLDTNYSRYINKLIGYNR